MGTYEEILETFKKKLKTVSVVEIADIPKIDLYMDQVMLFGKLNTASSVTLK